MRRPLTVAGAVSRTAALTGFIGAAIVCATIVGVLVLGVAAAAVDPGKAAAPRMEFEPPPPGSYQLQRIQPVTDAVLLDSAGRIVKLSALTRGKITLLTFFYTYCVDPLGCPFAHITLANLDPTHDTPPAIASYEKEFTIDPQFEWRFLTARRVPELMPVLDDFGQDVSVETDENGRATRTLHHMLKMFLIDGRGEVREIYTLDFLQPQMMFNDIKTLALEAGAASAVRSAGPAVGSRYRGS